MLFGPKRGSALTIFDNFAGTFGLPITVVVLAAVFQNMSALLENGVVLLIVIISPMYRLFTYFFTYYSVDEDTFHVKSGLLNKKELEIPLDRITTVDFTQNLIFQWTGVYSIKVDNASNYGGNGEGKVRLALKKEDAVKFKNLLLSKKERETEAGSGWENEKTSVYRGKGYSVEIALPDSIGGEADNKGRVKKVVPVRNILIMGALQSKGNAIIQAISGATVLIGIINIISGKDLALEEAAVDMLVSIPGIGIAAALILAFIVLSTALGALFSLIKYYGFSITDGGKSIYLEYGLFTRKTHSLLKEKISGAEFIQSLPMKFFKVGYLNVLAVGYGDIESPEKAMVYPLLKEEKLYELLSSYIPQMKAPENAFERPLRKSFRYFFICPRFIAALGAASAAVFCELGFKMISSLRWLDWMWYILALIFIMTLFSVILEYKNVRLSCDKSNVHFSVGGFTKITTVVKTEMIESVSDKAHMLKRGKGIVSISMGIMAPAMDSVKKIRNMHTQAFENIKAVMRY